MRQTVHAALALPAYYSDPDVTAVPVTVRRQTKRAINGALDGDYAGVLEGIDRLIFNSTLDLPVLRRGGKVAIPSEGVVLELDQQEPSDGPVNLYWSVVEISG